MKKVLAALCLMCGAVIGVNAQETTPDTQDQASTRTETQTDQASQDWDKSDYSDKEMISATELPSSVSEQLQGQDYTGWTMGNAYKKEKDGETFYAVEMKSGDETKMVKFDAQGNKVKEKNKDK
jgi:hypothetical protein